ncbi:MAG: sel1 repeat family protein [Flavobacterium sp.]|nr:MAG: sel1 repeat family protein [Flavobacterium sp.]
MDFLCSIVYEEGIEVPPDYELAYEYYHKAAELNNPKAKLNLGLMQERVTFISYFIFIKSVLIGTYKSS